ncbi:hypothetical protein EC988_000435 [Linderina pennispora]|nr:hypothetical protein EC988_000435 [Linderina pennispora]
MSINRFRFYDLMQKSISTALFATTVAGTLFIGLNVYNNWVEKNKLLQEVSTQIHPSNRQMGKSDPASQK